MKNTKLTALVFMLSLTACGSDQASNQSDQNDKPKTQLEEALSTQLDALEKSKQMEQELLDAAEKRGKELEDQGI